MKIEQFNDQGLAHFSYAILSECAREVVLIDPARNPQPYYDYASTHNARIVSVIETHPHACFVSSHQEVAEATGAVIRVSRLLGADYGHQTFDEGDTFTSGQLTFRTLNTPGDKIGYEPLIAGAMVGTPATTATLPQLEVAQFRQHPGHYTIVDVRSAAEAKAEPLFAGSLNIPLPELRERISEIPSGKPVVVHCAGGYRSAAGSSIVATALPGILVYDLGEAVSSFQEATAAC